MDIISLKDKIKSLPIIGWFTRWLYNLLRLNNIKHNLFMNIVYIQEIQKQLQEQERELNKQKIELQKQEKELNKQKIELERGKIEFKQLSFDLNDQLDILDQKFDDKASIEDTTELYNRLLSQKEKLLKDMNKLDKVITKANNLLPKELTKNNLQDIYNIKEEKFATFYKEFEDNFRGNYKEIKSSLEIYLPFIKNLNSDDIEILDIGCGRGEWLELIKESGFNAKGIDLNEIMVKECQQRELSVQNGDAIDYLQNLPNGSISAITGFHIIEHFSNFNLVLELLNESYRVLKRGGIAIFETPNTRNILVGANDFYLDPTHNRPLHPLTMEFFLSKMGFKDTKVLAIKNKIFTDIKEIDFNSLEDYITIGRNYALIGYKP